MPYAADSLFAAIIGANAKISSIKALGGLAATHVDNFRRYEPGHYSFGVSQGTNYWANANYYDRALIYYAWSAAEDEPLKSDEYFAKAAELALNYRDNYAPTGQVSAHWSIPCGVALHAVTTGDAVSKKWIMDVAETFNAPYYADGIGDTGRTEMDCRIQSRFLEAQLLAWLLTEGDAKYATRIDKGLDDIIATQRPDGSRPWPDQGGKEKPFMDGLLNDMFAFCARAYQPDERFAPHIKKNVDWLWANMWLGDKAGTKCFTYQEGLPDEGPAYDLNNLIIGGFMASGMADQVKEIFEGGLSTWYDGDKQFNQAFREAHRTCAQFAGAVSAWEGGGTVDPPVDPPIDPPAGATADIEAAKAALLDAHVALDEAYAAVDAALVALG